MVLYFAFTEFKHLNVHDIKKESTNKYSTSHTNKYFMHGHKTIVATSMFSYCVVW